MATPVCVQVAFNDTTLAASPAWTNLTDTAHLVASFQIDRGRSYELDRTQTGTATVTINDNTGLLDPTNSAGTYYGKLEPLLQIQLALLNPVTNSYGTLFRGYIEDFDYSVSPMQNTTALTVNCVDAFEILTAIEMQPNGSFGDDVPAASTGNIFFDNNDVDDRMIQVLGNAGWPVALQTIFSGNVSLLEAVYSPGENVLQVLQDCADAEFPGVGNVYVSKKGFVTFHGRLAKFNPVLVSSGAGSAWPFTHWKSGDNTAVVASPSDTAQVRALSFNRGLSKVINSAFCTPNNIISADISGQGTVDAASLATYGYRSWSAENLFTEAGLNDGLNAKQETALFAKYYVQNYANPQNRISSLSFRHMAPTDSRAAPNWALLCGAEISDLIDVRVNTVGTTSGGFGGSSFFIEGVHYDVQPATAAFADVTLTLDVSPQAYYTTNPFTYYQIVGVRAAATARGKIGALNIMKITGVRAAAHATGKAGTVFHT